MSHHVAEIVPTRYQLRLLSPLPASVPLGHILQVFCNACALIHATTAPNGRKGLGLVSSDMV